MFSHWKFGKFKQKNAKFTLPENDSRKIKCDIFGEKNSWRGPPSSDPGRWAFVSALLSARQIRDGVSAEENPNYLWTLLVKLVSGTRVWLAETATATRQALVRSGRSQLGVASPVYRGLQKSPAEWSPSRTSCVRFHLFYCLSNWLIERTDSEWRQRNQVQDNTLLISCECQVMLGVFLKIVFACCKKILTVENTRKMKKVKIKVSAYPRLRETEITSFLSSRDVVNIVRFQYLFLLSFWCVEFEYICLYWVVAGTVKLASPEKLCVALNLLPNRPLIDIWAFYFSVLQYQHLCVI